MFKGVFTALITPFKDDRVDETALRRIVSDQIAKGVHGLVPTGTTGESATLDVAEHLRVIEIVVNEADKRVPIIAGTGANSTQEAIELSVAAKAAGVDGMLQVTPYYNKPTQEGLFQHFKTIAQAVPLPTVLYNVPGRTGCDMTAETVTRLSKVDNIVAVKEATGSTQRGAQIIAQVAPDFAVLSGDDATALSLMAIGAVGISVLSNVAPADTAAMHNAALEGRWDEARRLHYKLFGLAEGLFVEANPIPVKSAMAMLGHSTDEIRLPMTPLSESHRGPLRQLLMEAGLLA